MSADVRQARNDLLAAEAEQIFVPGEPAGVFGPGELGPVELRGEKGALSLGVGDAFAFCGVLKLRKAGAASLPTPRP